MKFEELQKAMIAAMKERNKERKDAISSMVSAVKKVAIDEGVRDNITDDLVDRVLIKEMKTAREQIDTCPDERADLKAAYQYRLEVIGEFAPQMMNADEIECYIREHFAKELSSGNKGALMKAVMPALKGKADGRQINEVVARLCTK